MVATILLVLVCVLLRVIVGVQVLDVIIALHVVSIRPGSSSRSGRSSGSSGPGCPSSSTRSSGPGRRSRTDSSSVVP